ncbi:N-acetylmuramic acid 6-phosphate etherase [Pullulanibacillus pueri]|uniref:N-acetylmuramic acid 6-phosphate etherase n=1 Tax=Pullulanibacillus pueri TaxID=1437324 RepID=A0A8J2ZTZ9_9BACL|nr:N-acetylmuramic acid 6-phosphate etherase [Pullulanibacillus pueri]MBM7681850.1 N-acetylmuramic acid 6-phosphate etherase [Pullulanibacillus pueri]GGH76336.1 N-acetylmuramic acid 6-phosphate etherase [Pullulanibacillus pueri]
MDNHSLTTESLNPNTTYIDQMTTIEILTCINNEDRKIADAIQQVLPNIEAAVEIIYESLKSGGRVFLVGAGTSGRLGVLEAAECPPTFGISDQLIQAVIAGGEQAIFKAVESAEDDEFRGQKDLEKRGLTHKDAVIGIAASGRTPYVIGAVKCAKQQGAKTIALTCNKESVLGQLTDRKIEVVPGPEVISGSTRMKAGTAQKIVLNMITTSVMIKLGKVYQNLMVDLKVSNQKLKERAINIIKMVTNADEKEINDALANAHYNVKTAIVMLERNMSYETALELLNVSNGFVRQAIDKKNNHISMK